MLCWAPGDLDGRGLVYPQPVPADADGRYDLEITRMVRGTAGEPLRAEAIPARGSLELPSGEGVNATDVLEVKLFSRGEAVEEQTQNFTQPYAVQTPVACATPATNWTMRSIVLVP